MRNRLRRSEREAIRNRCAQHPVYLALRNPATELCGETRFRLSAEELFLWCMAELDELKHSPKAYGQRARVLVSDMRNDLRDIADEDVPDADIAKVACEVAFVLTMLLTAHGSMAYARVILDLTMQIPAEETTRLHGVFMPELWRTEGEDGLHEYVQEYMHGDECLSGEVEAMLSAQRETEVPAAPVASLPQSSLRIADGKQTSVLVVLDAMYKAGWFAKSDGSKATNRDKTLNEILQRAFNQEGNANISQLLNAAKKRNYKEPEEYLEELKKAIKT
mgnify:CR=1 FL=1